MNLHEIERRCRFYLKIGKVERANQLLQAVLSRHDASHWEWGVQRMKELDPGFVPLTHNNELDFVIEPDVRPATREEIAQLSFQYQKEWRFEREKRLVEHALALFPDWQYLHQRMEWHARPIFHRDPEKSKTQPRKPLHLPRDPQYIPKQETIDSMCFVTGSGSDQPYFDLSVQLLESIKATRWYNHVPIKVLDCGLTQEDADYLRQRFGCEVKDPGWDVDPAIIHSDDRKEHPLNGWKGAVARPYIHKHFPGYEYYFWVDTDSWVQDERAIDEFICLCEKQGMSAARECYRNLSWSQSSNQKNFASKTIPHELLITMEYKTAIIDNIFCFHRKFGDWYASECKQTMSKQKHLWGFELAMLNYTFYKYIPHGVIFHNRWKNDIDKEHFGVHLDQNKNLMLNVSPHPYLGFIGFEDKLKYSPYRMIFSNGKQPNGKDIHDSCTLDEEAAHIQCIKNSRMQGNYFYRIYAKPEDLYGKIGMEPGDEV